MDEIELQQLSTAWVNAGKIAKMGTAVLTNQRLLFFDQRFAPNAGIGGIAGAGIAAALQRRHEEGGPLFELNLDDISGAAQRRKLLNKDRVALTTTGGEILLNDGWKRFGPALRDAISARGRTVVDDGPEAWHTS